jgi:hypothetical protein
MVRYEVTAEWRVEGRAWRPYRAQVQSKQTVLPTDRRAQRAIEVDVGVALGILPRHVSVRAVSMRPIDEVSLLPALRPEVARVRSGRSQGWPQPPPGEERRRSRN